MHDFYLGTFERSERERERKRVSNVISNYTWNYICIYFPLAFVVSLLFSLHSFWNEIPSSHINGPYKYINICICMLASCVCVKKSQFCCIDANGNHHIKMEMRTFSNA